MKIQTIPLFKGPNLFLGKAKQLVSVTAVSLLLLVSTTASATPISSLYVFGDSLSDPGALTHLSPTDCPPAPYFDCRFSNGPVWAEILAADLGLSAASAYAGGTNYAIGGARTDEVLGFQVPTFLSNTGGIADPDALYVVWAGPNDLFQGVGTPATAVANIISSISTLAAAGAVDFLIPNTPLFEPWGFTFNALLASSLDALDSGLNITQFDTFSAFLDIAINPDDYTFTNITDPCLTATSICANPDDYLFWDEIHPTAAGHRLIAASTLAALSVSEPVTIAIFSIGLAGLLRLRRKTLA